MKKAKHAQIAGLFISLALLACTSVPNLVSTRTRTATATVTLTPTPSITPTPSYSVARGDVMTVESGGFRFASVLGYDVVAQDNISIYITSTDSKIELIMFGTARPGGSTIAGLLSSWLTELDTRYGNFEHGDRVKASDFGVDSVASDFSGIDNGEVVKGYIRIYEPADSKLVSLLLVSYGDQRWEREGQRVLDLTTKSLEFFQIAARSDCPITKLTDYGWDPTRPIKIGNGLLGSSSRIDSYLGGLLGAHSEIISYYRDPKAAADDRIVKYVLRIGNQYKILYFDTAQFEELKVPFGMKCSSLPPGAP